MGGSCACERLTNKNKMGNKFFMMIVISYSKHYVFELILKNVINTFSHIYLIRLDEN